jgi:signal transduction histidine kinase
MPARMKAARTSRWLATLALVGGASTLLGWLADVPQLADWFGTGIPQLPNNALATLAAGGALLLLVTGRRALAAPPALLAAVLGGLTLSEHLGAPDLGIDRLMLTHDWGLAVSSSPGRMGPPASTSFLVLGLGLLAALRDRSRGAAAVAAQVVLWIALLALIGYLLGAQPLYAIPRYTVISLQSAITLLALGAGLLLSLEDRQPMRSILAPTASSRLIRRVFPGILLVPVALGWFAVRGISGGLYDPGFAMAAVVLGVMMVLTGLLWWSAAAVNEHEQRLQDSRGELAMSLSELEREDRRKNEFLATLAHELRNPLAPIRTGLAVLGRADADPELSASTRAMMDRQVRHMVRLIDDLLDLSRITRDRIELRMDAVSLRSVLDQALEACTPMYEHARQLLVVDPPPDHLRVHGDAARLVQVFSNLLTNASKFTPPGGRIEVAHRVDGRLATVTVADSGRGIPAERLQDVFEMFTQLSSPLDRHHGGLGIGLTLSRRLVQMHGGHLTAASGGEGQGSTFSVTLPLMDAGAGASTREGKSTAP